MPKAGKKWRERKSTRGVVRPTFRPRVVIKFHDWVEVEYEDGAQREIADRYGAAQWRKFAEEYGELELTRLFTAVSPEKIRHLLALAVERDETYQPAALLTWFTADTPECLSSEELARILLEWEIVEKAYPDSEAGDPVSPTDDPSWSSQGYLDPAPSGIDAEYAWTIDGGDGCGQRLVDLEKGWTLDHQDLVDHGVSAPLYGDLLDSSRAHGTAVLGEICAVDNSLGCVGIAPAIDSLDVVSHGGVSSNVGNAVLAAVVTMEFGHVLLVEVQTGWPVAGAPIELLDDVFEVTRLATALGVVVVAAAGNGPYDLDDTEKLEVFDLEGADFRDSGAILVGAASSSEPHARTSLSSYGARVDCYAWGEDVETCWSNYGAAKDRYTSSFGGTSAAAAIIAGAALSVQGIVQKAGGPRLSPGQMRELLRDPAFGTASKDPDVDRIGVMPNLASIIDDALGVGRADVYLRDFVGDTGAPHDGAVSSSPDVILRPLAVDNPAVAYGEGSGTEDSAVLGYEAVAGQDNFIYARVRNRGGMEATDAEITVYWSEVATLITPDSWNLIGSVVVPSVPDGDVLRVADAIVWPAAEIPAAGHYCIVATVGTESDPVPPLGDLRDFDNFYELIRNNNSVAWRNFNVVDASADGDDSEVEMSAIVGGAPDRPVEMGLELVARLPKDAQLFLEAPSHLMRRLDFEAGQFVEEQGMARVPLRNRGRQRLGAWHIPARFRSRVRLVACVPETARQRTGYSVALRQFLVEDGSEVGRVTWFWAGRKFFERREARERYLLACSESEE